MTVSIEIPVNTSDYLILFKTDLICFEASIAKTSIKRLNSNISRVNNLFFGRKELVGLDIGSNTVKLVELRSGSSDYQLKNSKHSGLP